MSVVLSQLKLHRIPGVQVQRQTTFHDDLLRLADFGQDRPAGKFLLRVGINRGRRARQVVRIVLRRQRLLEAGAGGSKWDGIGIAIRVLDAGDNLREHEVAVVRATGTVRRQRVVGQRLNSEPADLGREIRQYERVRVCLRSFFSGNENGMIRLRLELVATGRPGFGGCER